MTSCEAAYYSRDERPAPGECIKKCTGLFGVKLEKCLRKWATCVKKAFKDQYGKVCEYDITEATHYITTPRYVRCTNVVQVCGYSAAITSLNRLNISKPSSYCKCTTSTLHAYYMGPISPGHLYMWGLLNRLPWVGGCIAESQCQSTALPSFIKIYHRCLTN